MPRSISSWATRNGPWQGWARAPWLARSVIKGGVSDPTARSKACRASSRLARRSFLLCDFFKPLIQDDFYIKNGRSVAMYWVQPTCCRLLKMRVP